MGARKTILTGGAGAFEALAANAISEAAAAPATEAQANRAQRREIKQRSEAQLRADYGDGPEMIRRTHGDLSDAEAEKLTYQLAIALRLVQQRQRLPASLAEGLATTTARYHAALDEGNIQQLMREAEAKGYKRNHPDTHDDTAYHVVGAILGRSPEGVRRVHDQVVVSVAKTESRPVLANKPKAPRSNAQK